MTTEQFGLHTVNLDSHKDGYFYVLRGHEECLSRVLDEGDSESYINGEFYVPDGCEVVKVPMVYMNEYNKRVSQAWQDMTEVCN